MGKRFHDLIHYLNLTMKRHNPFTHPVLVQEGILFPDKDKY